MRAAVAGVVVLGALAATPVAVGAVQGRFGGGMRACASEDAPGPCFWDATKRGNHLGRSFVRDARGGEYRRVETRAERECKDVAAEGAAERIGPRSRACERTADRLASR